MTHSFFFRLSVCGSQRGLYFVPSHYPWEISLKGYLKGQAASCCSQPCPSSANELLFPLWLPAEFFPKEDDFQNLQHGAGDWRVSGASLSAFLAFAEVISEGQTQDHGRGESGEWMDWDSGSSVYDQRSQCFPYFLSLSCLLFLASLSLSPGFH